MAERMIETGKTYKCVDGKTYFVMCYAQRKMGTEVVARSRVLCEAEYADGSGEKLCICHDRYIPEKFQAEIIVSGCNTKPKALNEVVVVYGESHLDKPWVNGKFYALDCNIICGRVNKEAYPDSTQEYYFEPVDYKVMDQQLEYFLNKRKEYKDAIKLKDAISFTGLKTPDGANFDLEYLLNKRKLFKDSMTLKETVSFTGLKTPDGANFEFAYPDELVKIITIPDVDNLDHSEIMELAKNAVDDVKLNIVTRCEDKAGLISEARKTMVTKNLDFINGVRHVDHDKVKCPECGSGEYEIIGTNELHFDSEFLIFDIRCKDCNNTFNAKIWIEITKIETY